MMAEAELHKERLQALAEKRKRQTEIEDKRRQLDDLVLQLQHLKSKAMRERWLLQGTPPGVHDEDDVRRRQVEQDELQAKKLEDSIHRLESQISLLENEESQISAKEQVLRDRLRETESSIEDLQKSLQNQDGDAVNPIPSQIPKLPELNSQNLAMATGDCRHIRQPALYAMEISVEKDNKTGDTKILSASRVNPEDAHQRGIKVYDDGRKVIYEVHSGSSTTLENGVHPWSSDEVEELMQRVGQARQRPDGTRVVVTPAEHGIREQSSTPKEVTLNVEMMQEHQSYEAEMTRAQGQQNHSSEKAGGHQCADGEVSEVPEATADKPVTMIFMGYHSVNDDEETKKLLGFDGTIKAEIVLIDEDDEKSLREKTVTDISTVDGNAADLVSGRPASEATELSSEGKDESSSKDPPPPTGGEKARCVLLTAENGLFPEAAARSPRSPSKSSQLIEDDTELRSEKSLKSVSFLEPVSVITRGQINMELEAQSEHHLIHATNAQNGVKTTEKTLDSEVAQEIRYLDEVLEANCCDPGADMSSNGTYSPVLQAICVDGNGPSVHVSDESSVISHDVVVEGNRQTTYVVNSTKPNGHSGIMEDYNRSPEKETAIKKEARFELRAFHEEKKPSKLFDTPAENEIRVKKVRPTEEIAELERERLELIKDQAVKKNPGIAAKWWNPPQEKTLEEELEPEQLESLRRYEERKQRKPEACRVPQTFPKQTVSSVKPEVGKKEDIEVQGIDFSAARKQFLQMEHTRQQQQPAKRSVAPQIYSARPFTRTSDVDRSSSSITVTNYGRVTMEDGGEIGDVKDCCRSDVSPIEAKNDDFTCARAVMTILKDEESDLQQRSMHGFYHPEEIDSGLDDQSLRSQDTTVLETLSNDFSMDNVSDSGASIEATSAYLENSLGDCSSPSTPMATTPLNGELEGITKSPGDQSESYQADNLTEDELEYHAGILVHNAIQQAIAHQNNQWEPPQAMQQSSPIPERHVEISEPSPGVHEETSPYVPTPKESTPVEQKNTISPKITVQMPTIEATSTIAVNTYRPPSPSPPPNEKPEFSYFSKYSEAAELRSTASVTRAQEPEVTSGPFKLRSRKQRTLSMIEEEIRAAQEREEELRRQRQAQTVRPSVNPVHKQRTNSLPAKLVLTGKTAPGKIEKIRAAPPVSPASSDGALPSPLSDLGSDDSGGSQRPKNFMQTLMEDYETHKVRRREKAEDSSVLEATRVTRRKSNMALRWEAGIYANQDEGKEEEEEEEEEE